MRIVGNIVVYKHISVVYLLFLFYFIFVCFIIIIIFQRKYDLTFHVNHDSHEMGSLIFFEKYKATKMCSAAVVIRDNFNHCFLLQHSRSAFCDITMGSRRDSRQNQDQLPAPAKVQNVKLVLLGDQGVGKSSIALRFVRGEFTENCEATIGGKCNQGVLLFIYFGNNSSIGTFT